MQGALNYFGKTVDLLHRIRENELEAIDRAAMICTDSIANGGLVFLFGNGHSRMMCEEMTPRQGCFAGWVAMVELALSNHAAIVGSNGLRAPLYLEKYEGYAEEILKGFGFGPHDSMIVISTSGIRPVVVEMAMGAKARGLPVVGICAKAHSLPPAPRTPRGRNCWTSPMSSSTITARQAIACTKWKAWNGRPDPPARSPVR